MSETLAPQDNTVAALLLRAADRVKQGWTQKSTARNKYDEQVCSIDSEACKWCALGAIWADRSSLLEDAALEYLEKATGRRDLPTWNDARGRTQDEVVAAFKVAVALASERAK